MKGGITSDWLSRTARESAALEEVSLRIGRPSGRPLSSVRLGDVEEMVRTEVARRVRLAEFSIAILTLVILVGAFTFFRYYMVPRAEARAREGTTKEIQELKESVSTKLSAVVAASEETSDEAVSLGHSERTYVFLGVCANDWRVAYFDGLPIPCSKAIPEKGISITARRGLKLRDSLPSGDQGLGREIGRVKAGQQWSLLRLHRASWFADGAPDVYWGEIERR